MTDQSNEEIDRELSENTAPATMGHLTVSLRSVQLRLADVYKKLVDLGAQIDRLLLVPAKLAEVETKLASIESRPELKHRGVWTDQEFPESSLVTFQGGLWLARASTRQRPGQSRDWLLIVKSGRAA